MKNPKFHNGIFKFLKIPSFIQAIIEIRKLDKIMHKVNALNQYNESRLIFDKRIKKEREGLQKEQQKLKLQHYIGRHLQNCALVTYESENK